MSAAAGDDVDDPPTPTRAPRRLLGVGLILVASSSFTVMGGLTKVAITFTGSAQIVFWRSLVVGAVALALMRRRGVAQRPGNVPEMAWRAVVGLGAMVCFFWSLGQIPLGTATTLLYTHPLFVVALSGPILGERPDRRVLPLAAVAFVGIVLVVQPGVVALDWGSVAALASGLGAALAYMSVRKLRTTDPPSRIVYWFSVVSAAATAPFVVATGPPADGPEWLILLGVGVFAAGGQMAMTWAYRVERAEVVGPFSYLTVLLSYLVGLAFWDEVLDLAATVGMLLVVAAGFVLTRFASAANPPEPPARP